MAYPDPFAAHQKTSGPQQDNDNHSAAAVVTKARRNSNYVPFQDSHYYNGEWGSNQGSGSYDERYNPGDYKWTPETIRRRKFGSSTSDPYSWGEREYRRPAKRRPRDDLETTYEGRTRMDYDGDDGKDHRIEYNDEDTRSRRSRGRRRSRTPSRSRRRSHDRRSRSQSTSNLPPYRPPQTAPKDDPNRPPENYNLLKAAKSAAMAGGVEAVRCRSEPGPWNGQKAQRVALAAAVGVVIGSLRNGRNQNSGKKPYAEAAMTGFYAIDFLKRVARHTEFDKGSKEEQRVWREDAARKEREERLNSRDDRRRSRGSGRDDERKSYESRR